MRLQDVQTRVPDVDDDQNTEFDECGDSGSPFNRLSLTISTAIANLCDEV
jgi:hypothetical protein